MKLVKHEIGCNAYGQQGEREASSRKGSGRRAWAMGMLRSHLIPGGETPTKMQGPPPGPFCPHE